MVDRKRTAKVDDWLDEASVTIGSVSGRRTLSPSCGQVGLASGKFPGFREARQGLQEVVGEGFQCLQSVSSRLCPESIFKAAP